MGILSSLFQTGAPAPQVAGPTIATTQLPKELAPYYKDILGKAQALYKEKTAEGFQPYQGPTIAAYTPEQEQAFKGIAGLVGSQAPIFEEAIQKTKTAAAPMTQEQLTTYMSPYQQAVVDIEKREAQKQYESQVVPQLAAQAATTGGFGGSRQAILEGMAGDTQQRLLSDIQAKGSQQAYEDAIKRFQADRQAQGQAGAQLATMAPQQFKAQLGELGAIQTIGEDKQRQQQTALDEAFRQYQLEQNYPYDTMARYQSVVTGAPLGQTTFAKPPAPTPSIGQQLIGGLGTLVGTYGAFGGKLPQVFAKKGGGLNDLPVVYRQTSGKIRSDNVGSGMTAGFEDMRLKELYPQLPGEDPMSYGARLQAMKEAGPKTYYPPRVDATEIAEAAKAEGQGKTIDTTGATESAIAGDLGVVLPVNKNKNITVNTDAVETIKPVEVTGDGGITAIDALQSATGNTFFEGTKRAEYPKIDTSGVIGLRESTNQLNADINAFIDANKNRLSSAELKQQIEDNFGADVKALEEYHANEEKILKEQQAEDVAERSKYFDAESATAKEALNRQQYANLAQFFARLGTASPKQEGIAGVLGAGLEAAEATIPQAMQTRQAYQTRLDTLRGEKRAEERSDKAISRTEQKNIRKDLYSGKKDLTKSKREDLIAANDRDIDKASKIIAARSQGLSAEGDVVNAEITLAQARNENAILALEFDKDTDFSDIFPDPGKGNDLMMPLLGGDAYKNRPDLNKKVASAWNRAYAEIIEKIKAQDKVLRKDDLTKQEVTLAVQTLAKSYLDASLSQKPPPGNNVETEDSAKTPDNVLVPG